MKLHIVIPAYNQFDYLDKCLKSIVETYPTKHYIVVHVIDNGSEAALKRNDKIFPNLSIIYTRFENNKGVTVPWNYGARYAMSQNADAVCISNSDVIYGEKTIEHCLEALEHHGCVFPQSIQGGPMPNDFMARALVNAGLKTKENCVDTAGFAGWCFFLSAETIHKIGFFDDQFTLWYQDTDYHWRLRQAGINPVEVRSCLLHHFESRTIVSMPGGFSCYGWREQDEKRFFAKWPKK